MIVDELIKILQQVKEDEGTGIIPIKLVIYPSPSDIVFGKDSLIAEGSLEIGDIYFQKQYSPHLNDGKVDFRDLSFRQLILGGRKFKDI